MDNNKEQIKNDIKIIILEYMKKNNNDILSIFKKQDNGELFIKKDNISVEFQLPDDLYKLLSNYDDDIIKETVEELLQQIIKISKEIKTEK